MLSVKINELIRQNSKNNVTFKTYRNANTGEYLKRNLT